MNHETIFQLANGLALAGWVLLIIFYRRNPVLHGLLGGVVALLCMMYALLVFRVLQPGDFEKFRTLEGVSSLMSVPGAALVGWIHYLAFDLMTGIFIAANARRHGVRFILLLPCLVATFMLGPFGLLLYLVVRWYSTGHYFAANYHMD